MPSRRKPNKKLVPDKETDHLFEFFANSDKFNKQMKEKLDKNLEEQISKKHPKLDSSVVTTRKVMSGSFGSDEKRELPSNHSSHRRHDVDFTEDSETCSRSASPRRSPFKNMIYGQHYNPVPLPPINQTRPILANKLIENVPQYIETAEERRARARDEYSKLQDLVEKYNVTLTRHFTLNDDPDEMKAEYDMWYERRNKVNQVKMYKNILFTIICSTEFLNEKYNPFDFKLKDWSKQVASDMDEYGEILEEIYEKYKDSGGKMAPEIKLVFLIIMSGITYHLSQSIFGSDGMSNIIKSNPSILSSIGKIFTGMNNGNMLEPQITERPSSKKILNDIRSGRQKSEQSELNTETNRSQSQSENDEQLRMEKERRLDAEHRAAALESQLKKQNEMIMGQFEQLKQRQNEQNQQSIASEQPSGSTNYKPVIQPVNQVLSGNNIKPRFHDNPIINSVSETLSDQLIFDRGSEGPMTHNRKLSAKKSKKQELDEIMDSLDDSVDIDLDHIAETSSKKKMNKSRNSSVRPSNKSISRERSNMSEIASPRKKKGDNVIVI